MGAARPRAIGEGAGTCLGRRANARLPLDRHRPMWIITDAGRAPASASGGPRPSPGTRPYHRRRSLMELRIKYCGM